ncbi:carbohydrate kinase [Neobacillus sp. 179-C4.2 HS]|uniref:Carbohydrate kinase n=1 Tax=Neobacillus driksii TaxID=3035913 RepID=A0ABV4YUQ7_9BACI|nr:carbohydrate kinase [Neobacillus sp. 179.-C4.2 HS]MDP5194293.1 carbohydrate kinase [Neobacillus sp. 179.-C4.2 HS]
MLFDVCAIGELLIDFTSIGPSRNGNQLFERNPGGAPANVLTALAKLNKKTAFLGKVGDDQFGHFLEGVLNEQGIDTSGLRFSKDIPTTLAFVHLDKKGDRSFSFYRNPGADITLTSQELNKEVISKSRIFHFGSLSLTHEPVRNTTLEALIVAKENHILVSYDPNLRPALWNSLEEAKEQILKGLEFADIVKLSEEEFEFLTQSRNVEAETKQLCEKYNIAILLVTMGQKGCYYRAGAQTGYNNGFKAETIDTTGAGDAFFGGILYKLLELGLPPHELTSENMDIFTSFANGVAALSTTRLGGIPSMPTLEEVEEFLKINQSQMK